MTKNHILAAMVTIIIIVAIAAAIYIPRQSSPVTTNAQERLAACGSLPNGSTENATETSRMFINLPKDIYPDINLEMTPHGAMANYISNGGQYGYALDSQAKPDCWSYYFEFDLASSSKGAGNIDIGSKSGVKDVPNYLIHINVTSVSSSPSTSTLQGNVGGQVLLSPICPVERMPPDPNCAPKPYQTTIVAFKATATSTPFLTTTSDLSGTFAFSLPSGAYILRARGGSAYPRCQDALVQINVGKSQNVVINCDTGIR
jgi:hypothetical protein